MVVIGNSTAQIWHRERFNQRERKRGNKMTREALNKLNEKQMWYCITMLVVIDRDRKVGAKAQYEKDRGKLRGFFRVLNANGNY